MIKYPVNYYKDDEAGGYVVEDSDHDILFIIQQQCIDFNAVSVAQGVTNTLNAVHEFPSCAVGSSWINTVLIPWFKKLFPDYDIHHTEERDCLCERCADT